jgi:hypothetical protein
MVALPRIFGTHPEPRRLILEPPSSRGDVMLTLVNWRLETHPRDVKAHSGALEAHPGEVKARASL